MLLKSRFIFIKTYETNPLPKNKYFVTSLSRNYKNNYLNSTADSKGTKNILLDLVNSIFTVSHTENSFPKENIFNSQTIKCSSPHKAGFYYSGILNNGNKFLHTNSIKRTISTSVISWKGRHKPQFFLKYDKHYNLNREKNISKRTRSPE